MALNVSETAKTKLDFNHSSVVPGKKKEAAGMEVMEVPEGSQST